jgi:hypothetical protein
LSFKLKFVIQVHSYYSNSRIIYGGGHLSRDGMAGHQGWKPGQTLRPSRGRARWPAGLEHSGGGEWHKLDGGWRPGWMSRTQAEAECGGRPVWHVRAVEGGPSTKAAGSALSRLLEHGAEWPSRRAAWQVASRGARAGGGQAVGGGGGPGGAQAGSVEIWLGYPWIFTGDNEIWPGGACAVG